jgi:hypothetical protein
LPFPGFSCDISLAGIEGQAAEVEENIEFEPFPGCGDRQRSELNSWPALNGE